MFLASGFMLFVASPPFGFGILAFISLIPFLHAVHVCGNYRLSGLGGFLAGAALFLPGIYWLTNVTVPGYVALALYCATYLSVFALLACAFRKAQAPWNAAALGAGWMLLEVVRGHLITGFPWLLLSHTQYDFTVFTQVLDITGAYTLSGVMAAINVLLYRAVYRERRFALAALAIMGVICLYGFVRLRSIEIVPSLRIAAVQASVPQEMKETLAGKYDPTGVLFRYVSATGLIPPADTVDMIVWPETVLLSPYTLNVSPNVLTAESAEGARLAQSLLAEIARNRDAYILAGATSFLPAEHGFVKDRAVALQIPPGAWENRYNSAYLLDPNGVYQDRYDKIHLVPFGEYIPMPDTFPFLAKLVPFTESLREGDKQTIFRVNRGGREAKFGVLICYEDLDPELARGLRQKGADFFVNISNDAWFGTSIELDQHFAAARLRAIENRVGVVRSGNNGITGIIDPAGRVTSLFAEETNGLQLTKDVTGYLTGEVAATGEMPVYTRFGDWPWITVAATIVLYSSRKRRL